MSRDAQQAVDDYFDVLLTAPEAPTLHQARVGALLEKARQQQADGWAPQAAETDGFPASAPVVVEMAQPAPEQPLAPSVESAPALRPVAEDWRAQLDSEFPCLYFKVAGLTLAVPLQLLGGIKRVASRSKLPGQPSWMLGVQTERDERYYVVDSARWLMPDRSAAETPDYQYLVQLGDSRWTLACEALVNAEPLSKDEVNWRKPEDKRRYLAGVVRKRMCVVLDVPELVDLLDAGLDINLKES
ncbi:chemotaxis protein CheW [Ferrimonas pelagia]|uniref:CheW-like domain-containing protein n=1 Tax=Ferrimonas pelagia TaxID=1177826 RepID=A0ABP9EF16_9GAMM